MFGRQHLLAITVYNQFHGSEVRNVYLLGARVDTHFTLYRINSLLRQFLRYNLNKVPTAYLLY